ncbi:MAG: preprotein translocase subunit SecG [Deltaproteobacteria bacterium]|nr:preprotein translocase subunit SecG [Deltaproteobacteria bacterium]
MQLFITILHIVLAVTMILIILLQPGKEGGAALAGGSSGNQMYGPRGAGNFLGRATTVVASLFMFTSITLAWYSSDKIRTGTNVMDAMERRAKDKLDASGQGFGIPMPSKSEMPALPSMEEILSNEQAAQEAQDAGETPDTTEGTTPDGDAAPELDNGE